MKERLFRTMALEDYRRKRKFQKTPEPTGREAPASDAAAAASAGGRFVVQMHHATRLHFDFRLEMAGVLKSWAVPKGPTLDPAEKRLAMMVEDHPLEYLDFEGIIPAGNYGAGTVMVWDLGTFEPLPGKDLAAMLEKGDLKFILDGEKLRGEFALVRMKSRRPGSKGNEWLLLKKKDAHAQPGWKAESLDRSVLSWRTMVEIAGDAGSSVWGTGAAGAVTSAAARTMARFAGDPASLPAARAAPMPAQVRPMLATGSERPMPGADWLHEIKWDGIRALAYLDEGKLRLVSRNLRDITAHYPDLGALPQQVRARQAILDGEIVCLDADGRAGFERLQQRMNLRSPDPKRIAELPATYYAFDLLYLDGYDLRQTPLEKRKETLRAVLAGGSAAGCARFSDHQVGEGDLLFELARKQNLEGIISKRRQSPYREERSGDWVKVKTTRLEDCVVCGWTDPQGSRQYFGALVLGLYRDGKLVFVGSAGSGFDSRTQKQVWEELEKLASARKTVEGPVDTKGKPHWVEPKLVAEIKFTEWTSEGRLRAPVFLRLRPDKSPEDCAWEEMPAGGAIGAPNAPFLRVGDGSPAPTDQRQRAHESLFRKRAGEETVEVDGHRMRIQNLDKVFFPEDRYTKADLVEYYFRIADYLLPHMHDKPVVMKRYPNGIHHPYFFQKDAGEAMPAWVRTESIPSSHGSREMIRYVIANDRATLVYLANLACIDQNLWMSRIGSLDNPDFALFDLDPGETARFENAIEVARVLGELFSQLGVKAYPKTSGASGLHIYVPLEPIYSYDQSRSFAELICRIVEHKVPRLITHERSLNKRPQDRIYLDYIQNGWGKTVPPPYSVRPHAAAPVSAPLRWEEVRPGLEPRDFTIRTIWPRLTEHGDLFEEVPNAPQRLEDVLERLPGML